MFALFDRTEENKELYDLILNYNHKVTSHYPTSFCFCLDMWRLSIYYLRQLSNFENPRFNRYRKLIIFIILAVFVAVIYPLTLEFSNIFELVEDIVFYLFTIIICGEYLYRRIRNQTNEEFEQINSRANTENNSHIDISSNVAGGIVNENPLNALYAQNEIRV